MVSTVGSSIETDATDAHQLQQPTHNEPSGAQLAQTANNTSYFPSQQGSQFNTHHQICLVADPTFAPPPTQQHVGVSPLQQQLPTCPGQYKQSVTQQQAPQLFQQATYRDPQHPVLPLHQQQFVASMQPQTQSQALTSLYYEPVSPEAGKHPTYQIRRREAHAPDLGARPTIPQDNCTKDAATIQQLAPTISARRRQESIPAQRSQGSEQQKMPPKRQEDSEVAGHLASAARLPQACDEISAFGNLFQNLAIPATGGISNSNSSQNMIIAPVVDLGSTSGASGSSTSSNGSAETSKVPSLTSVPQPNHPNPAVSCSNAKAAQVDNAEAACSSVTTISPGAKRDRQDSFSENQVSGVKKSMVDRFTVSLEDESQDVSNLLRYSLSDETHENRFVQAENSAATPEVVADKTTEHLDYGARCLLQVARRLCVLCPGKPARFHNNMIRESMLILSAALHAVKHAKAKHDDIIQCGALQVQRIPVNDKPYEQRYSEEPANQKTQREADSVSPTMESYLLYEPRSEQSDPQPSMKPASQWTAEEAQQPQTPIRGPSVVSEIDAASGCFVQERNESVCPLEPQTARDGHEGNAKERQESSASAAGQQEYQAIRVMPPALDETATDDMPIKSERHARVKSRENQRVRSPVAGNQAKGSKRQTDEKRCPAKPKADSHRSPHKGRQPLPSQGKDCTPPVSPPPNNRKHRSGHPHESKRRRKDPKLESSDKIPKTGHYRSRSRSRSQSRPKRQGKFRCERTEWRRQRDYRAPSYFAQKTLKYYKRYKTPVRHVQQHPRASNNYFEHFLQYEHPAIPEHYQPYNKYYGRWPPQRDNTFKPQYTGYRSHGYHPNDIQ